MKIYDVNGFPNPLRVRLALAEKQALDKVEFEPVDVMAGEHRREEFLAKNPAAGVPVLELEDGTCLAESSAIIQYLDESLEGISLTGSSAKERASISMYQRRAEFKVLDAIAGYFHHATEGLGPTLENHQNNAWGEHQKQVALNGLSYFDQLLSGQPYVAGEVFSAADITLYAGLVFAQFAKVELPEPCQNIREWQLRVESRPSFKQVLN